MLERLVIHNFQCHHKLVVDFDPQITTIMGQSDQGKSAVLRALRLVCFNAPSGTAFITHGEDECKIILKVDGHKIIRTRSKSINEYSLDGIIYKAFGQGNVPDDIERLLNVGDINWQRQHDPPFWFSLTPGQVSKELNTIINLGLIDDALAYVGSELRKARAIEDVSRQRLQEAQERKTELAWTVDLDARLKELEQFYSSRDGVALKRVRIDELLQATADYEKRKVSRSGAIVAAAIVLQTCQKLSEATKRRKQLENTIQEYKQREDRVCQLRRNAASSLTDLQDRMKGQCPVCGQTIKS